jgi:uncharacterized membrane protein YfcA
MIDFLTYIYLFPLGIIISICAMSAGISGSNFWIPVYLIGLGIDPKTTFWLALLTMVLGFGSGIIRNLKQKTVNWPIVQRYLKIAVPFAVLGSLLVPFAPVNVLLVLFASFVLIYGAFLVHRFGFSSTGKDSVYPEHHDKICWIRAASGGFLKGLIASGTGKLIMPCILRDRGIRSPAEAVGSTVVIIFIVNIFAVVFRLTPDFISILAAQRDMIVSLMIWVAPGVIIGGQIGPSIARRFSERGIRIYVGILLIIISLLIYGRAFFVY